MIKRLKKHYIRSNVRVVFEDPDDLCPQAFLQYRVKFLFFRRWVTVNESYYRDRYFTPLTPEKIIKKFKKEGQRFKSLKIRRRRFFVEISDL